jgi:hypothetical protein
MARDSSLGQMQTLPVLLKPVIIHQLDIIPVFHS